jgi:hypothetical protein
LRICEAELAPLPHRIRGATRPAGTEAKNDACVLAGNARGSRERLSLAVEPLLKSAQWTLGAIDLPPPSAGAADEAFVAI